MNTEAILKYVYPIIEDRMKKYSASYKKCVSRFIQKRHDSLYDTGPNDRIYFTNTDREDLFTSIHITEAEIIEGLSKTYYWNEAHFSPKCAKDPTTIVLLTIVRYYSINNMNKDAELAAIYLAFSGMIYASLHVNSFKKFPPSENRSVMDYVVNNVLTQKYDLKTEGTVIGAVRCLCITWINKYKKLFKSFDDEDVKYLLDQIRNRIKSFIINIAKEFYKAYEQKEYLNFETDSGDEDNYRIADNDSVRNDRIVENTINYLTSNSINYSFCRNDENVKKTETMAIIEAILSDNRNLVQIRDVINVLVADYMKNSEHKDINSTEFITYSLKAKPNIKDKDVIRMKQTIESWLDENSTNYRRRKTREATKNSYYKMVLSYIVLSINRANNNRR